MATHQHSDGNHAPAETGVSSAASNPLELTSSQEGPWYAFCREYATTQFDHSDDPEQLGTRGHRVPQEAQEGAVEITRNIQLKGLTGFETETFDVKTHTVGDFATCVTHGETIQIIIATVPDPNATQMPLEFDRDIEAIQEAAAAQHFNYTRFWFPWRGSDWKPSPSADPEAEVRRREEPGILCFRKNARDSLAGSERLFVLLVGETPTSGVNRLQLAHALSYRDQLKAHLQPGDRVRIAGPHFSASFPAIEDVLADAVFHQSPTPSAVDNSNITKVNLVSPDASGKEFLQEFKGFCDGQPPRCTLHSLSLSSDIVKSTAIAYLNNLGYTHHIAELNEDEVHLVRASYTRSHPLQRNPALTCPCTSLEICLPCEA